MIYWTEPEQRNPKTWVVKKIVNGVSDSINEFKSKQDAFGFLKTINIYINWELVLTTK